MSKIGVGIGEDFPADDTKPGEPREHCDWPAGADYEAHRAAYRKWREQRREIRRRWREEWRAWRRTFRAQMRQQIYEKYGDFGLYDTKPSDWNASSGETHPRSSS